MAGALLGGYLYQANQYLTRFLPGTRINGIEAAGMTPETLNQAFVEAVASYELIIMDGIGDDSIGSWEVGLAAHPDDGAEKLLASQSVMSWPLALLKERAYELPMHISCDADLLKKKIRTLNCIVSEKVTPSENAYIGDAADGKGFAIIPETQGNEVDEAVLYQTVEHALLAQQATLVLSDVDGIYRPAEITSENVVLVEELAALNHMTGVEIVYESLGEPFVLDGSVIKDWIIRESSDGATRNALDREKVASFVADMAVRYNTAGTTRQLISTYGPVVEATGPYGWKIDEQKEVDAIIEAVSAGRSEQREPVYSQRAASRNPDWGTSYVEVNLTAQYLYLYVNGESVLESPFVSGNVARGWTTPPGIFGLYYKQRGAVLRGPGYASPVSYWMPFNRGIGFHDATWRGTFGGSIYLRNGSHGCINMPVQKAKELFGYLEKDFPIFCYNLEGTSGPAPTAEERKAAQEAARLEEEEQAAETERTSKETKETERGVSEAETTPATQNKPMVRPTQPDVPPTRAAEQREPETTAPRQQPETIRQTEAEQLAPGETMPQESTQPETEPQTPISQERAEQPPEPQTSVTAQPGSLAGAPGTQTEQLPEISPGESGLPKDEDVLHFESD